MFYSLLAFGLFGLFGLFFFFTIKTLKKKNSQTINLAEAKLILNDPICCPRCQETMKPGFVLATRGIIWRSVNDKVIGSWITIFESLDNTISIDLPPKFNLSWICQNCQCVLVDYSRMVNRNKPT